jgi:hypothetical protein
LGKLFAKILNTRLENFLFKRNIISPELSFNIMSMPLDFLFFNENIPSIISLSVILKSSSEKICSSSSLLRSFINR